MGKDREKPVVAFQANSCPLTEFNRECDQSRQILFLIARQQYVTQTPHDRHLSQSQLALSLRAFQIFHQRKA